MVLISSLPEKTQEQATKFGKCSQGSFSFALKTKVAYSAGGEHRIWKINKLFSKGDLSQGGGLREWLNRAYRSDVNDHANSPISCETYLLAILNDA